MTVGTESFREKTINYPDRIRLLEKPEVSATNGMDMILISEDTSRIFWEVP